MIEKATTGAKSTTQIALENSNTNSKPGVHTEFYGRRNRRRFLQLADQYIPWQEKTRIQGIANMMVGYIVELEKRCQDLITKNNELIAPKEEVAKISVDKTA